MTVFGSFLTTLKQVVHFEAAGAMVNLWLEPKSFKKMKRAVGNA